MSQRVDAETAPEIRQRRQPTSSSNDLQPSVTNSNELTDDEIVHAMDSPITFKDILSLLAVVIPIGILVYLQGWYFSQKPSMEQSNPFLNFLADLRNI